eukprot:364217-Hanusia_phi.AAC.2
MQGKQSPGPCSGAARIGEQDALCFSLDLIPRMPCIEPVRRLQQQHARQPPCQPVRLGLPQQGEKRDCSSLHSTLRLASTCLYAFWMSRAAKSSLSSCCKVDTGHSNFRPTSGTAFSSLLISAAYRSVEGGAARIEAREPCLGRQSSYLKSWSKSWTHLELEQRGGCSKVHKISAHVRSPIARAGIRPDRLQHWTLLRKRFCQQTQRGTNIGTVVFPVRIPFNLVSFIFVHRVVDGGRATRFTGMTGTAGCKAMMGGEGGQGGERERRGQEGRGEKRRVRGGAIPLPSACTATVGHSLVACAPPLTLLIGLPHHTNFPKGPGIVPLGWPAVAQAFCFPVAMIAMVGMVRFATGRPCSSLFFLLHDIFFFSFFLVQSAPAQRPHPIHLRVPCLTCLQRPPSLASYQSLLRVRGGYKLECGDEIIEFLHENGTETGAQDFDDRDAPDPAERIREMKEERQREKDLALACMVEDDEWPPGHPGYALHTPISHFGAPLVLTDDMELEKDDPAIQALNRQLWEACENLDIDGANDALVKGAQVNARDIEDGMILTAIFHCCAGMPASGGLRAD